MTRLIFSAALVALLARPQTIQAQAVMPDMAMGAGMSDMTQSGSFAHLLIDQLEGRLGAGGAARWDAEGWIGDDDAKLWVKSEGNLSSRGKVGDGDQELLYDRAITTFFDLQAGLRSDLDSRATRQWAALGIEGLAPLFLDVEATAYVSDQARLAAKLRASWDLLITQRLILQPEAEITLYSRTDSARLVGSGISDIDSGLRLRYEITRKFAPYIGVTYQGDFGQTADLVRKAGEPAGETRLTIGIRAWF